MFLGLMDMRRKKAGMMPALYGVAGLETDLNFCQPTMFIFSFAPLDIIQCLA